MPEERKVDFAAVARIARRVDLRNIRLVDMSAKLLSEDLAQESLSASTDVSSGHDLKAGVLSVDCQYSFDVASGGKPVAQVNATYRILYEVKGPEQAAEADLSEFAFANGTYHSWPFLRQLVFDFTARIGFAPYTLPVFRFSPEVKRPPTPPQTVDHAGETAKQDPT